MKLPWLVVFAALVLIIGCGGGSSSSPGGSPSDQTRSRLQKALGSSQLSMLQAGFQTQGQADAVNGSPSGTTGGTSGGGGFGMPMIGAFLRNMGGGPAPMMAAKVRGDVGTTGSTDSGGTGDTGKTTGDGGGTTGGWDGNPSFYYDEWLGLWVESSWSEGTWDSKLYIDEAKNEPAGYFHSTYSKWDSFPVTGESKYEITAGAFAGAHGAYSMVYEAEMVGHMEYDNFWPGYGSDEGRSEWGKTGWTWSSSQKLVDGSWSKSSGTYGMDGTGHFSWENSDGYRWSYQYNADGSGSGLIEGPDPGLPAKVSWTPGGKYRIEYADGTVDEWDMYVIMSGVGYAVGGGVGTSGSTGGGGGGG